MDEETKAQHINQIKLKLLTRQFYINPKEKTRLDHEHQLKLKKEQELQAQKALEHVPEQTSSA